MIPRVPQCLSPRMGGPDPPPLLQVCPPLEPKGGHTLTCGLRGWGVPIRTTGENAWHIILILILLAEGDTGAPIYWRRGASERQYIGAGGPPCANILAHLCPPPPIGNADQAQCANNIFSCSVRHSYWRRVDRCANSIGGI
jgi:hypothetical protein